ncbi:GD21845 [Drosophila simulans]|uniref:GD21845 n=1 Tax=Drosophila simulans TaxID=7240 RepID=B4Q8E5_DROSI|nr:GD21845 [Drosophila simulans]
MSCLKSILQLLQVLTMLSGCNIYRYVEGRRVFKVNPKINFLVGAVHRFWLRPYLLTTFLMHVIFWLAEFRNGLTDLTPGSERPLKLIYRIGLTVAKYQNVFISTGIAYHYRHHQKLMRQVLNEFIRIYYSYERICVIFVCIQPLLLSLVVYLGIMILYACYDIQLPHNRRKSFQLFVFYRQLIRLRYTFNCLVRSFVWAALAQNFFIFIANFHLILYDQQSAKHFAESLFSAFICPVALLHINVTISSIEKKFGQFKASYKPQRQTQMMWLYMHVVRATVDKSGFNAFRLDRGHILELLRLGWSFAMFTNAMLLNSTARLKHFQTVNYKKLL